MHYYNDGSDGFVYDPLYRMRMGLTPCEQAILMHPALRRLQRIAHQGAVAKVLPVTYTSFAHTVGVYVLAVHFRPTDWVLRVASLLHDVARLPFSHAIEPTSDVQQHDLRLHVLRTAGLSDVLQHYSFDEAEVLERIEANPHNPMAGVDGGMSLTQLDAWLRTTEALGSGITPPHMLLDRLSLNGHCLEAADQETATEIVRRAAGSLRQLYRPRCLALQMLAAQIVGHIPPDALVRLGDEEALLLAARTFPELVDRLRNRPWSVSIRPDDGGPGWLITANFASGQILLVGRPVNEVLPEAAAVYKSLDRLKGVYRVTLL